MTECFREYSIINAAVALAIVFAVIATFMAPMLIKDWMNNRKNGDQNHD